MDSEFKKIHEVEFCKCPDIGGKPVEGLAALTSPKFPGRMLRTRSEESWNRECYLETLPRHFDEEGREVPGRSNLHFISYNASNLSYILETSVRIGKGYERQESVMTVDELKSAIPEGPASMVDVVRAMSDQLEYSSENWAPYPEFKAERETSPLDPDDPLRSGRGAEYLPESKRDVLRKMLAADPVDKKDLPEGVLLS